MGSAPVERFEANRRRLASIAYRLLGSAADAEDVVQDAFLRWHAADRRHIAVPEAWLTKVVTNLALDRLRSAQARRERASGDWLPEPLLDGDPMLGPADTAEQREAVTMAVLILLERLQPIERAVYVLREAFAYPHAEIADILDISEAASQQHAHRARRRVAAEPVVDATDGPAARRIVEAFIDAASSGRPDRLVALLTADATALSDGAGGTVRKWLRISGSERVAAALRAVFRATPAKRRLVGGSPAMHAGVVNGSPAVIAAFPDRVVAVVVLQTRDDRIAVVHGISSPDQLHRVTERWRNTPHHEPPVTAW
ncbi:RNA polymerase sigma factor SigJ [Actinoplanes sp. NPDC049265]|uniref:RNA polymerase sigma factor SigJ n=1 Tax=Actinoplanes sp. NPDC049265 TaxID=3363902 RepID=UPI00371A087F